MRIQGLNLEERSELQAFIQARFLALQPDMTLKIYLVPKSSLREFTQDSRKYQFCQLPEERFRLEAEEWPGTQLLVTYGYASDEDFDECNSNPPHGSAPGSTTNMLL